MVFVDGELFEPDEQAVAARRRSPAPVADRRPPTRGVTAMTAVVLAVLALAAARRRTRRGPEKTFAIMGGTLLTVGPQGTIANGTILVRGGRILAVGAGVAGAARARR